MDDSEWAADRQSAVEFLELAIAQKKACSSKEATMSLVLPLKVAEIILDCAKKGIHKGQGRGRPGASYGDKLRMKAIVAWARKRKAELIESEKRPATGANSAEDRAAEEACELAKDRYGLSLNLGTIRRRMQSSPDK